MEKVLEGKRIIVAGGGGGIASGWCKSLAALGAKVLVNDVGFVQDVEKGGDFDTTKCSRDIADGVVREITSNGGVAVADYENVADFDGAGRVVEHCMDAFGGIDILLNTTCVSRLNECIDLTPQEWEEVIRNNLYPVYNLTKQVLPYMIKQQWGRLLYTNSATVRSFWGSVNYGASYGGVYSFMRCIANEVRPDHITANCIEPTCLGKTGGRPAGLAFLQRRARALGLLDQPSSESFVESLQPPEAISPLVAYLCTENANNVTGQYFGAKGGRYCIFGTLEEKRYIYKDVDQGYWTVEELAKVMPATLEQDLTSLWYPRV